MEVPPGLGRQNLGGLGPLHHGVVVHIHLPEVGALFLQGQVLHQVGLPLVHVDGPRMGFGKGQLAVDDPHQAVSVSPVPELEGLPGRADLHPVGGIAFPQVVPAVVGIDDLAVLGQ